MSSVQFSYILRILFEKYFQNHCIAPGFRYNDSIQNRKGGCALRKLVASILEDLSTREVFLFRVSCAGCGSQYTSRPARFSKAGSLAETPEKQALFAAVYAQELETARRSALRSVAEQMNYCPICKRIVCNRCFLICDDLDMCSHCAAALGAPGMPVLPEVIDAAT